MNYTPSIDGALERMPHKGAMRLIDRIVAVSDQEIHCAATPHFDVNYPLRMNGILFSTSLVELGAQAAAAHASLFGIIGNHTGLLIGLQDIKIEIATVTDCNEPMDVTAQQLHFDSNGSLYSFKVASGSKTFVTGRAALKMQGEPE